MKVMLEPDTGAVFMGKDKDGKEIRLVSMTISPYFETKATANGRVALGKSLHKDGTAIDSFALKASAKSGKVTRGDRPNAKGATPEVDLKKAVKL